MVVRQLGKLISLGKMSVLICEAAGFYVILIETVGVGQSETTVRSMVDFFMLLMLAGAGDELQGIKRGNMEMADMLMINKADDPNDPKVKLAMGEYKRALHLFPPKSNEWIPKVLSCSALKNTGITESWQVIQSFENHQKTKGYFEEERRRQALEWFEESIGEMILERTKSMDQYSNTYKKLRAQVSSGELEPGLAAHRLVYDLFS